MFLARDEAEAIARRAVSRSRADSCFVWLNGSEDLNIRFASRGGATNGAVTWAQITVTATFGQRQGQATANAVDPASVEDVVARAEAAARLSPENPEVMPPLAPQAYPPSAAYSEATATLTLDGLAALLEPAVRRAERSAADIAAYAWRERSWRAFANSAGALGYDRSTQVGLSLSARNKSGTWSGWSGDGANDAARLDADGLAVQAIDKALAMPAPVTVEPGKYVVLLEPAVVGQFVNEMMWRFNARGADEGRSFLSRQGGGTKLGERLFDPRVTLTSDPADPRAPGYAFDQDGVANKPVAWVEGGVVKTMIRNRFWARKTGSDAVPAPGCYAMAGGDASVQDMIRDVKRGVLVTRLWYVRTVDPRSLLLTGLTRDGTFLIENGKIAGPCNNFRFNESPVSLLRNVLALGPSARCTPPEAWATLAVPPVLAKDFTFSSISPAV